MADPVPGLSLVAEDNPPLSPRELAREAAIRWLGTPYHHQASLRGVGCDCLGLVRGVYAEIYGLPAEAPPAYSRDLAEASHRETLLEAARRHLLEIDPIKADAGDVLVFRLRPGAMAKHCGILTSRARMIHAMEGGPVCEVHLAPWHRKRTAAAFRFPDIAGDRPASGQVTERGFTPSDQQRGIENGLVQQV